MHEITSDTAAGLLTNGDRWVVIVRWRRGLRLPVLVDSNSGGIAAGARQVVPSVQGLRASLGGPGRRT